MRAYACALFHYAESSIVKVFLRLDLGDCGIAKAYYLSVAIEGNDIAQFFSHFFNTLAYLTSISHLVTASMVSLGFPL
jgi:hypothetical protein